MHLDSWHIDWVVRTARPDWFGNVPSVIDAGGLNTAVGTPYLNPAAFGRLPATSNAIVTRLGTAPRVLPNVRDLAVWNDDVGISKSFFFTEKAKFEIRGDAFNVLNRAGRGGLVTDVSSPLFGRLTGQQQGPRSIQVSARIEF